VNFEQSPTLKDFQHGLPEQAPRRRRLTLTRLVILLLLLSVASLAAMLVLRSDSQQLVRGVGSVRGFVVDENGQPFQAEIYILGTQIAGRTDASGYFQIDGVPAGTQYLIVADERVGHEFQIAVLPGEVLEVGSLKFISTATP